MQRRQIFSRLITVLVILAQVLAGVSGALPAQVALAATPSRPLAQAAKPSAAAAAGAPALAAQAAPRPLEHQATGAAKPELARSAGPEVARPVAPAVVAAAPVANPLAQATLGIGNTVWKDLNGNGLRDSGEPGIPGVTVGLYDATGNAVLCMQPERYDTYRDEFTFRGTTNSNGTLDWSSKAWVYTNSTGLLSGVGNPGGALQVYGGTIYYVTRAVDLSVFVSNPTLRFDYNMKGVAGQFNILYSVDGGASFTNLALLSDNNSTYKTITYTLPSLAANAQIRIQGAGGGYYAYFDNLTIRGQVRYPVTSVTDANGLYSFTGAQCLQPNLNYQVRIDTTQTLANPLYGLFLTTPNAGGVTSNDPTADGNDSDASSVTVNGKASAVINLTTPATGVNNSYAFGFAPVSLSSYVWKDSNADGLQTGGEPGLAGVTVGLYDSAGNSVLCPQAGRYETYQDNFNPPIVNNASDGTLLWTTSWSYNTVSGIGTKGNPGGSLQMYSTPDYYATRPVDLSVFAAPPTLRFDYNYLLGGLGSSFALQYSVDRGATFQTFATLSDNNTTYKTITYTLPSTSADMWLRIRGVTGTGYAYFDNITIRGQVRYPVTAVTDANGRFTFSGTDCVQPNTAYQVRIAALQNALYGLALTKPNAGGVTSNDPTGDTSDSDASGVTINDAPYAVINTTSPALGPNASYALGFVPSPVGTLQVNKTVNGAAAPAGWQFALSSVNCPLPPNLPNPLTTATGAGGSVTFPNLLVTDGSSAACQYQVSEKGQTGWFLNYAASDPVTGVQVKANSTTPNAVVNNQIQTCKVGSGDVGGLVFQDFNMDGQQNSTATEPGYLWGAIVVRAYGKNNQLLASAPIQPDGSYVLPKLPNLTTDGVRLEFQNLAAAGVEPTTYASAVSTTNRTSGTLARFVKAPTCNADLGVNRPANYCQANPQLGIPTFYYYDPASSGSTNNNGGFTTFNYDASGSPKSIVAQKQFGSIWGTAYQNSTKTVFVGASTRSYIGYGPLGRGGIYTIDLNKPTAQVSPFVDLQTLGVVAGDKWVNAYNSPVVAAEVGKTSFGDVDISEDGKTLYVMNLYQRELVLLDIASKTVTQKVPVPDPGCLDSRTTPAKAAPQDRRPWAIEAYNGQVYIGVMCSAETSQLGKDVHGYVMRLQGNQLVPFFNFPMSILGMGWQPWGTTLAPILADMEFDERGALFITLLNLADFKNGDGSIEALGQIFQFPYVNGQLTNPLTKFYSSGKVVGGSALKLGSNEIVSSIVDGWGFLDANVVTWFDSAIGGLKRGEKIAQGFIKGEGLGDMELLCDPAPLEIGNRVWNDTALPNGVQDPNEPGIAGVIVGLYNITGTLIVTTTTNVVGEYYFNNANVPSGLKPNTDYTIRINRTQAALTNFNPTLLDQVVNNPIDPDEHDSDGNPATNAGYVTTPVRTGNAGQNDYSFDFGFTRVEIGNYVWRDNNGNGLQDANEPPLPGVTVGLYDGSGNAVLCGSNNTPVTTLTDARGHYTFTATSCVQPSTAYQVGIDPTQPTLLGFQLTKPNGGGVTSNDPTGDDSDSDATLQALGGQTLALINLTAPDAGANYSYDFGFIPLAIGNYVWRDINADGKQDPNEPGIPGVTVGLYDTNGNAVLCPQVGRYDTYADALNSGVNNESTGSLPWGASWTFAGSAAVFTGRGNPGGSLTVYGLTTSTAARTVDLSVFAGPPTLRLDYIQGNGPTSFNVQYSSNGGTSFTTLATLNVNSTSYKTITYTLPITAANAQIRIQGVTGGSGIYAAFDNVTIRGQARYPVIDVTDSSGFYDFSNLNCVQPNTTYQVRIDTTQVPANPLYGLFLTKQNAGGVTSNDATADDSDSDASSVTINGKPNAVLNATSPAIGVNYSYDFGFTPVEIGNYVWKDLNGNGLQESDEPPIPGVTVGLYDASGNAAFCLQNSTANLALNKTATQVSDYSATYLAGNAVDGNTATGMAVTGSSLNSWWQVDLGQAAQLRQVVIYPRPDGFHTQTEQIYVLISNQPFASTTLATTLADPNVWHSTLQAAWTGASLTVAVPSYLGRYVRIQHNNTDYLGLGEVQVFGEPYLPVTTVTDSAGHYVFTGVDCVQASTAYQVRLDLTQDALFGLFPTTQNAGGVTSNDPTGDDSDSDASRVTINSVPNAVINATAPAAGVNYSYDFGFVPVEIGNYVWQDINLNGLQESDEPPIPGVTVGLYDSSGNAMLCPQSSTANLALNQPATQVSDISATYLASNAVDGNTISGGSSTGSSANSWWQVDLGQSAVLQQVVLYARPGGTHTQSEQVYVLVSNQPFASTNLATTLADANVWHSTLQAAWTGASLTVAVPSYLGRYVRIQHNNTDSLSLGEVQVFGEPYLPVTTVTDSAGHYVFTGANCVQPSTAYQVRLDLTQDALFGLFPTTQNAGGVTSNDPTGDDSDSDASRVTINGVPNAVLNATSPAAGINYSYDFGFVPVEIGNYVWKDTNADGQQDSGEPPIPGVTVGLYDAGGKAVMCPQTGRYDTYADAFNSGVANGSTGSLPWGTTWSFAGSAAAYSTQGNPGGSMYVYGAPTSTAARTVDLSVFAGPPTLRLDYIQGNGAASFNVQYSSNGGTSFTTLATLNVNTASYKTITYTLPITAANAQIRIQGVTGGTAVYAYFDNVTVQGQLRYPVTDVTDAYGFYSFSGLDCLQPSTAYQVRIDTTQLPTNPLYGLFLTTQNADGVTSNDPTADDSDSDASSVTSGGKTTAVINLTSPAAGTNYSYDFGFTPLAIGNYVWKDLNNDGQQDLNEPPIPGVTVGLYDNSGNAVMCPQVGRYDTYRDEFSTTGNTNTNGTLDWSGKPWVQTSTSILSTSGNPGGALQVYGGSTVYYATRAVDLSGFVTPPTLSFDYNMAGTASKFNIQYSANGGTSFTTLAVLSDNNNGYKTITYTLPINAANAQIRIAGFGTGGGTWAYFDNVTVQGQVGYPVTDVTDSNGLYTFTGANCVQPSTTYQVRIATDQYPLNNLHLTTQDAGGVTSNDPTGDDSDSDAANITANGTRYARINALSPAVGTNYSYDFGFTPDTGTIVLRKATTPAGSSQSFAFTSNVPGHASFTLRAGESYTMTQVPIGVYAVTETLPAGWTQIASSCTNVSTLGAVQVSQATTTTCTITNALQPPTSNVLTVTKTVNWNSNPPNAAQQFNINITGPSFPGGKADTISAGQTKVYTNVVAGVYTVTETSPGAGWVMTYSVPSGVVNLGTSTLAPTTAGLISGNVFNDFNADGVDAGAGEPGVAGVTVTAYDPNGVVRGSATTDANGNYSFTPTGSGPYRIEFTTLPDGYYPTMHSASNGTSTQFVTTNGGATNVNLAVSAPENYCQNNPMLCTAEMIAGDPANATTGVLSVLKKWSYAAANGSVTPTNLANDSLVGSVWGLAYARRADKLYSAAFLKRHAGLGPNGLGAIYVTKNPRTGVGVSTGLFFDVATLPGVSLGTVPSNSARGLTTPAGTALDVAVYDKVGKVGLGNLDITDDESMLWTISLNDKKLIGLSVNNPSAATAQLYTIPDPGCNPGTGDYRPFALKYYHSKLYVGVTCDASLSRQRDDLKAVVYRFDPVNAGAGFTNVLNVPLNYTKGAANTACTSNPAAQWFPWVNVPYPAGFNPACPAGSNKILPQPLLSDFEFDLDGSLILGFMDRFANQTGSGIALPDGTLAGETMAGGETLRAWNNQGVLVLENNGTAGPVSGGVGNGQGPGGGEFYRGDFIADLPTTVNETSNGALAFLPVSGEVVSTIWDPFTANTRHGVAFLSNTNGNVNRRHDVGQNLAFSKGSGLGDLEILCDAAPLEIGNRVWKDLNGNGVQDPGEPGLANVTVALQSPTNTVTLNTDANGLYYFRVNPNTAYTLTVNPSQTPLNGLSLTQANMQAISGSPYSNDVLLDTRDSDAVTIGGKATLYYKTGLAGQNNHGLDFGWAPAVSGKVTINNKAPRLDWGDNPDQYDTTITKTGAAHIIVPGLHLGASEDTEIDGQPSTAADGDGADEDGVQFPTLKAGSPAVLTVTATNTGTTAATLYGWIDFNGDGQFTASERVTTTVPAGTNNGVFSLTYNVPVDAVSATYARFRLSTDPAAAAPTGVALDGEVEDYPVTLQTVSFVRFGDRVWLEADADGLASTGVITPIVGMVITATTGTNSYTTTTDSQGYYSFTVTPGTYTVRYGSVPAPYGATVPSATPGGNAVQGNAGSYREAGNADQSHANGTTVTLSNGEANWQVDFAFHAPHADLHLVKLVDKSVTKRGDTVVYTLVLTNDGPDTATDVQVKDLLPATVLYQSATAQQGAYDVNTGLWTVGTVAVNSSVTLTITVKIR